jgi:TPR repeat protein
MTGPQVFLAMINEPWSRAVAKAASDGHADAQFEYAMISAQEQENSEAEEWFSKSAEQGYRVDACYNSLGILSIRSKHYKKAVEWFQKSAAQGNRFAQHNLGILYVQGRGIQQGYRQAAEWFQKSAEQEFSYAQQTLGVLYALGKGVTQDDDKAIEWLRRGRGEDSMACRNFLAELLATCPGDEFGVRNGHLAITIAEELVQSSKSTDYLYTLAAAYAEAGRFEDAVKTQQKLITKLKRKRSSRQLDAALQDCQKRLNSYRDKKPWRNNLFPLLLLYWDD